MRLFIDAFITLLWIWSLRHSRVPVYKQKYDGISVKITIIRRKVEFYLIFRSKVTCNLQSYCTHHPLSCHSFTLHQVIPFVSHRGASTFILQQLVYFSCGLVSVKMRANLLLIWYSAYPFYSFHALPHALTMWLGGIVSTNTLDDVSFSCHRGDKEYNLNLACSF